MLELGLGQIDLQFFEAAQAEDESIEERLKDGGRRDLGILTGIVGRSILHQSFFLRLQEDRQHPRFPGSRALISAFFSALAVGPSLGVAVRD